MDGNPDQPSLRPHIVRVIRCAIIDRLQIKWSQDATSVRCVLALPDDPTLEELARYLRTHFRLIITEVVRNDVQGYLKFGLRHAHDSALQFKFTFCLGETHDASGSPNS